MKVFYNLAEALSYHHTCYVCGHYLTVVHDDDVSRKNVLPNYRNILKWNLSNDWSIDDWLSVDIHTNQITYRETITKIGDNQIINTYDRYHHIPMSGGSLYQGLDVECAECFQFHYTIQIMIDMEAMRIGYIRLNSEHISWEENDSMHQIKNIYATDKTEYSFFAAATSSPNAGDRHITLPLVPLDLQHPAETLGRIKKLIIFS